MMIVFSDDFMKHEPPSHHPENPQRLELIIRGLRSNGLDNMLTGCECNADIRDAAVTVHSDSYVSYILRKLRDAPTWLDEDTYLSTGSEQAIKRALGCSVCFAERALNGEKITAFLLVRPPGHHAGINGAAMGSDSLGFCIFNNAAIVAKLLSQKGNVFMLDFDSHHGNGTQEIFYTDKKVIHLDIHQHPGTLYPGTGWPDQTGEGEARGTKLNIILPPGASDDIIEDVLSRMDLYLQRFSFDYIVVSAGFDAFLNDGLANLRLSEISYYNLGSYIRSIGKDKPIIVLLEGGYSVGLERGVPAFVKGLSGLSKSNEWLQTRSDDRAWVKYHSWREEYEGYILGLSG
jgi:acetoin utilization deacetylase AcuC-like enzyme